MTDGLAKILADMASDLTSWRERCLLAERRLAASKCGTCGRDTVAGDCCGCEADRLRAQLAEAREALGVVLMLYSAPYWDNDKMERWAAWCCTDEATTKSMCDKIRAILSTACDV